MRLDILYWRIRLGWRAAIDNHYARRAYRVGWKVDGEGWFFRRVRNVRPERDPAYLALLGQDSGNAFLGTEADVHNVATPDGVHIFCRDGQQAVALDKGRRV